MSNRCSFIKALSFLFFISIIFVSCQRRPRPPALSDNQLAVASVGSVTISDKDLENRIEAIEKTFPRVYSTYNQKKRLLEEMMNIELLYQKALELGLDKRYEFKSRLADLYVQQMSEKAKGELSDQKIREFFEANRDKYEQISAKHILLKFESTTSAKSKRALKDKIEKYRKELVANPEKFSEYAQKYSEDGTRNNGGELGFFTSQMMVAPFSKAAFSLKKIGEISPIVETQYGYHLIQLSGDKRGFESYKDLVRDQMTRATQRERLDQELEILKKGKKFQIYEDNLAKISPLPKEMEAGSKPEPTSPALENNQKPK